MYKEEEIQFNSSLQEFNKAYLHQIQLLSEAIKQSVNKINEENAALHKTLKAIEDANIEQANWEKTKGK